MGVRFLFLPSYEPEKIYKKYVIRVDKQYYTTYNIYYTRYNIENEIILYIVLYKKERRLLWDRRSCTVPEKIR